MCGIVGHRSSNRVPIDAMTDALVHRGPDGRGTYIQGAVGLGHRRLSIIDIAGGTQPMQSSDGNATIVFNGEIYNYRALRADLEQKGFVFHTSSDTEVLLNMYLAHGTSMLEHLNGMFAFCIHDRRQDILFGARDRLGIKPFYLCTNAKGFFFASEIKALLASDLVSKRPDMVGLDHYFTFRYIPAQRTAFEEIKKLPPGHAFTQDAEGTLKTWKYWDFEIGGGPSDLETALERFDELLTDAVRLRLISDVPLGAFLSGGMDSTTIVAIMKKLGHSPLKTFTIGFGTDIDETSEAEISARHYGCEHLSFEMPDDAFDHLPSAIFHMDEPFGDPILVAYKMLSEQARKSVTVILTGEGADEGQMGYIHHEALSKGLELGKRLPKSLLSLSGSLVSRLPVSLLDRAFKYPSSMGTAGRARLGMLLPALKKPGDAYFRFTSLLNDTEKAAILGTAFTRAIEQAKEERWQWARVMSEADAPLQAYYRFDFKHWLPDNILNKQDRMTMAHSIEGRVPFLDHRVVEFLASLPQDLKLRSGSGKYLLSELYNRRYRPPARKAGFKKAFMVPMEGKFRPAFDRFVTKYLSKEAVATPFFNSSGVMDLMKKAPTYELLYGKQLMSIGIFNVWKEVFSVEP